MNYIGVDIGGTSVKIGVVDDGYNVICKTNIDTKAKRPCEELCEDIYNAIVGLTGENNIDLSKIDTIGVSCAGIISDGKIVLAGNLGYKNVDITAIFEKISGKKIYVQNDANVATFGELIAGCGKGFGSMCAVTIGTGVGGGVVINGKIIEGYNGYAGEIGHMIVEPFGLDCACGKQGCLEKYCSTSALVADSKDRMMKNKDSILWETCGNDIEKVNGKTIFEAYHKNDKDAVDAVNRLATYIGISLSNLINLLQPEIVCVGGGVSEQGDAIMKPIEKFVHENTFHGDVKTLVRPASLGNDAGIIGAGLLFKNYK